MTVAKAITIEHFEIEARSQQFSIQMKCTVASCSSTTSHFRADLVDLIVFMRFSSIAAPTRRCGHCEEQWFSRNCSQEWRPRDLDIQCGSTICLTEKARMWFGQFGDPTSEGHRSTGLGNLEFKVIQVDRTKHYTQAQIYCDQTRLPVWVNVWHRFNNYGFATGVQWASVATC